MGLTDLDLYSTQGKGAFVWSDGSGADFFNWNTDEPADSEERCGRIYGPGMGGFSGKWNNDLCSKTAAFICEESGPPKPNNCPGSESGSFTKLEKCPASVGFEEPGKSEITLNSMCDSYCESNCPAGRFAGMVTIASPTGTGNTCVCFKTKFGDGGITRIPYGGCSYDGGKSLAVSEKCSKALWHFPRTEFITEYEIGMGFGPATADAPFGAGNFPDDVHNTAKDFNTDADEQWQACLGTDPLTATAPCYNTITTQTPDTCTCAASTKSASTCATLGGSTCTVDMHFVAPSKKSWTGKKMVDACYPTDCTVDDIKAITQYVIDDWVFNTTQVGIDDDRLTDIDVGNCGASSSKSGSTTKDAEIAGAVVGVLLLAGVGFFIYKKRSGSSSGGLGQKFMVSARSNRGAL